MACIKIGDKLARLERMALPVLLVTLVPLVTAAMLVRRVE
jgi:hypothetical protein